LLAVIAASFVGFFGGWLIFGMALSGYYEANSTEASLASHKPEDAMVWWAMILDQLTFGLLVTWVVANTGSTSAAKGAVTAAILMSLVTLGMDLFFYAMMDMFDGLGIILVDVIVNAAFGGLVGAVVGWIL
jgi:hypothetical protein